MESELQGQMEASPAHRLNTLLWALSIKMEGGKASWAEVDMHIYRKWEIIFLQPGGNVYNVHFLKSQTVTFRKLGRRDTEQGFSVSALFLDHSLFWGLSCALQDVSLHAWPLCNRCIPLPVVITQRFRHCQMSSGGHKIAPN